MTRVRSVQLFLMHVRLVLRLRADPDDYSYPGAVKTETDPD